MEFAIVVGWITVRVVKYKMFVLIVRMVMEQLMDNVNYVNLDVSNVILINNYANNVWIITFCI